MEEYLKFAKEIARYAGFIIKKYFYKDIYIEYKEDKTPVTIADQKINNYLIEKVKLHYPTHSVDGEEAIFENKSKYVWVCDPIDGTSMFTRHIPIAVFSLALVYDGNPIVGVVYDPFLDEMYTAIEGKGAFCNDIPIHVNDKQYGSIGSSIDYCMWNGAKYDVLDFLKELRKDFKTSELGSVAHASMLVASGKISGEIFPGTKHANCDLAASALIVKEAGGTVTNFKGENQRYDIDLDGAIITNGIIHQKILKLVNRRNKNE